MPISAISLQLCRGGAFVTSVLQHIGNLQKTGDENLRGVCTVCCEVAVKHLLKLDFMSFVR